jgi:hypothetical protein
VAPVIIDDGDARRAARRHGLTVHKTLWVLCQGLQDGVVDAASVETLIATLRTAGARLPSFGYWGFEEWARRKGFCEARRFLRGGPTTQPVSGWPALRSRGPAGSGRRS